MGWLAAISTTHSTWVDFLPALAVAGVGMGCTFAPMTTTAMRSVQPRVAGAASGMINTTRQVGAVIGTAAVGALLQNRLAVELPAAAARRAGVLPAADRARFVSGFHSAASSGASLGAGQSSLRLPPGTPPSLISELETLARQAFSAGFTSAMHQTLIMPIVVLAVAALSCLAIKRVTSAPWQAPVDAAAMQEASQAAA
jgi:Major Facilitator Superfamily